MTKRFSCVASPHQFLGLQFSGIKGMSEDLPPTFQLGYNTYDPASFICRAESYSKNPINHQEVRDIFDTCRQKVLIAWLVPLTCTLLAYFYLLYTTRKPLKNQKPHSNEEDGIPLTDRLTHSREPYDTTYKTGERAKIVKKLKLFVMLRLALEVIRGCLEALGIKGCWGAGERPEAAVYIF
ncbi:hypothetical protein BC829DRAFT_485834, partial [Chytridium lagenaria]